MSLPFQPLNPLHPVEPWTQMLTRGIVAEHYGSAKACKLAPAPLPVAITTNCRPPRVR